MRSSSEMSEGLNRKVAQSWNRSNSTTPLMVAAPGRINLIGEHIDYNNGWVMPAAVNLKIVFAVQKIEGSEHKFNALDMGQAFAGAVGDFGRSQLDWPNYFLGVLQQFHLEGLEVPALEVHFAGDIPSGAGLSSSAALECGFAFAINEIMEFGKDRKEMALLCQRAENQFVGVNCGIMDQFASLMGKKDHFISLDCDTLEYEYVPSTFDGCQLILCNTKVSHSLGDSAYNVRRAQCESVIAKLQPAYPHVKGYREVDMRMLSNTAWSIDNDELKRAQFVLGEIERVTAIKNDLAANDYLSIGEKLNQTHQGLSKMYEVSCPELDFLAAQSQAFDGVFGSRMMGGGFGGCTLNLVRDESVEGFASAMKSKYQDQFGIDLEVYPVETVDGVKCLDL